MLTDALNRLNALKLLMSLCANGAAAIFFAFSMILSAASTMAALTNTATRALKVPTPWATLSVSP